MGRVVTIDGPAASGKTSVSRELAKKLGWSWVSTGSFYRGLAFVAQHLNVDATDEGALADLSVSSRWRVQMGPLKTQVFLDDRDVTDHLIQEEVGNLASIISHFPKVRAGLLAGQRNCSKITEGLVAEGRDCGTVVFPEAELKFYLTANSENRAERRAKELGVSAEELVKSQAVRDSQDANRKTAPMQIPENAIVIDTTTMSFEEVVSTIFNAVNASKS